MIEFTCECGHHLRSNDARGGRVLLCPACGKQQPVPSTSDHLTAAPTPTTYADEPKSSRPRRFDDPSESEVAAGGRSTSGKAIVAAVLGVLAPFCTALTGLPALIFGFMALGDIRNSRGRLRGKGLAYVGVVLGIIGLVETVIVLPVLGLAVLLPAVQKVRQAAVRMQSTNNLKQMGLAMHTYHDTMNHFPEAYTLVDATKSGQPEPGMSWRVALLPYIDDSALYSQFKPQEPWDSPSNRQVQAAVVKIYQIADDSVTPPTHTHFQVFVTAEGKKPHALFDHPSPLPKGVGLVDVTDGTATTILFAESATPVPWAKPQDMPFDPDQPPPPLGRYFPGGSLITMADGSVRLLPASVSPATLKALITRDGKEKITDPNW